MCFAVNQENKKALEKQLEFWTKRELELIGWAPRRWVDAFSHPKLPVLMAGGAAELAEWGLVPGWVKDEAKAKELQNMTLNARLETIFELPSFRGAAPGQRCLVPVNGFFEYQHRDGGKVKVPHRLFIPGKEVFYLGGLWSEWRGRLTFTICTKEANTLMREIHNSKMRMPVIVPDELAEGWLAQGKAGDLAAFQEPRDDDGLVAEETVGRSERAEMES